MVSNNEPIKAALGKRAERIAEDLRKQKKKIKAAKECGNLLSEEEDDDDDEGLDEGLDEEEEEEEVGSADDEPEDDEEEAHGRGGKGLGEKPLGEVTKDRWA